MALKTASTPKRAAPKQSPKKSPKKLTLLDLIDIDQLVNEHAEVVSTTTDTLEPNLLTDRIEPIRQIKCVNNQKEQNVEEKETKHKINRKCSYCRKGFTDQVKLKEHVKNCFMKKYPCKECDLKFATESKLERHVNECHLQIKEFECKDCEKSFARKDKLAEHVEAVHQKKQKYLCSKCGKGFYHKFNMTRHVITCKKRGKNKEPRECPECDRVFTFQSELKRHVEVVHLKVKRHKCEHCSKGFSQKCMLEDHVNAVHLKKREHQCQDCGNSFARLSQLNRHVSAVHLLEKQHECPECDKSFARRDRLKSHVMAVHVKNLIKGDTHEDIMNNESVIESVEHYSENIMPQSAQTTFLSEPQTVVGVVDQLNNFNVIATQPTEQETQTTTTVVLGNGEYVHGINIDENEYEVVVSVPANLEISNSPYKGNETLMTSIPSQPRDIIQSEADKLVIVNESEINKQPDSIGLFGSKPIKYVCPECDEGFSRKDRLKTHIIDSHLTTEGVSDDDGKSSTPKKSIQENSMCIIDSQAYDYNKGRKITDSLFNSGLSEEQRKQKMKKELTFNDDQNKYQCPECPKCFARTDKLDDHISTVHFMERRHQCTTCGKSFAYKHGLERHVSSFHLSEGKFRCRLCEDRFEQKEFLDEHIAEVHSNQSKIRCEQCDKWFARKRSLEEHISVVHLKEKKYKCSKCSKSFSTKGVRKSHMAVHSKEKPHKCSKCGKGFNYKHILARHISTHHSNESPRQRFNCADCDKTFFSQIKLLKHVKSLHSKGNGLSSMDGEEDFSTGSEKDIKALPENPNENTITKNNETHENGKKCES